MKQETGGSVVRATWHVFFLLGRDGGEEPRWEKRKTTFQTIWMSKCMKILMNLTGNGRVFVISSRQEYLARFLPQLMVHWWFGAFGGLDSERIPENERDWDS